MADDIIPRPCLCCNQAVSVSRSEWLKYETPAALCQGCFTLINTGRYPWPQVQMLYLLRCQVATLRTELDLTKKQLAGLATAQRDYEQTLLRS